MNKNSNPNNMIPTQGERPKLLPPELVNEFDEINTAIGELETKFKAMVSELASSQTKILSDRIAILENMPRPQQLVASNNNCIHKFVNTRIDTKISSDRQRSLVAPVVFL